MKRVCAWCGKDMGEKPPYGGPGGKFDKEVTHGMCDECSEKAYGKRPKRDAPESKSGAV